MMLIGDQLERCLYDSLATKEGYGIEIQADNKWLTLIQNADKK